MLTVIRQRLTDKQPEIVHMDQSNFSITAPAIAAWLHYLWPLLLISAAAAVVCLAGWWFWWRLPQRQVDRLRLTIRDAKARADIENNFRKIIGQLFGAIAVLIGVGLAYMQFQQQQQAAREVLISNQVSKGFEQMGSDKVETRLGGIYALEGVMNTSERYHQPVLEALSAFIRDHTRVESAETRDGPPVTDVQAALTVIGRRTIINEPRWVGPDLENIKIPKAYLFDANFSYADIFEADLSHVELTRVALNHANLSDTKLNGATLIWSNLSDANLSRTDLSDAKLHDVSLRNTNVSNANLRGANLSLVSLTGARLLTQEQLNQACGMYVDLDPGLTIRPCK